MDFQLKVSTEILKAQSDELKANIEQIKQDWSEIRTIVARTKSYWEGKASDEHQRRLEALADDADTAIARLLEHPEDLLEMAGIYDSTESRIISINEGLPADVIS